MYRFLVCMSVLYPSHLFFLDASVGFGQPTITGSYPAAYPRMSYVVSCSHVGPRSGTPIPHTKHIEYQAPCRHPTRKGWTRCKGAEGSDFRAD